ncbi:unnamed protein product [Rhizoctonia solani]|uniref:Uncharacterized protein n=1 Tax=Rhizoctonia solani TaxID=456999 RepID=A0A8H3C6V2_9AGAM|nr:unnamed protein product [Rhizoctonia solani]
MKDCVAPIFRCACPDLPGKPINLPNIMLGLGIGLRFFACLDIIQSVLGGKQTCFQYEVPFSLDLCNRMQGYRSYQSIQGIPDQFIMFFAWVNSLCETPGASDSPGLVAWVEEILPQIKLTGGESGDPLLRFGRIAVQECWRFAAYIYLYMVLCRVDAYDPRVVEAQKGIMRLVNGIKPARYPDAFLAPMIIAAVATFKESDRNTIRQRFLGVRECSERGTMMNECVLGLEDIWERTKIEGRPAVWSDLRIALRRVTGK